MMRIGTRITAMLVLISLGAMAVAGEARGEKEVAFEINAPSMAQALMLFAKQSGLQLMLKMEGADEIPARPVVGEFTPTAALEQLLEGSGLRYEWANERTVAIRSAREEDKPIAREGDEAAGVLRVAQKDDAASGTGRGSGQGGGEGSAESAKNAELAAEESGSVELDEIVVTGTHIRGATSTASPVHVYTREEIDSAGLGSVREFIQRLPQNFNGGASDSTIGTVTGGGQTANEVGGTGVNLRGLGNDSSLVLVNGHRIAPGNTRGNFVDVSLVPLSALERVEVVPDGASAIYGSDAVGGVVNFILRKDFKGAESRIRYGAASNGHPDEVQVGQTFGLNWNTGSALLSYEFFDRQALLARDRDYTESAPEPTALLPEQRRHSAFMSLNHAASDRVDLFADGMYAQRSTALDFAVGLPGLPPFFRLHQPADIDAYSATLGGQIRFSNQFALDISSSYSNSTTDTKSITNGVDRPGNQTETDVLSLDTKLDGPLWELPAGAVLAAIGAQYRVESFEFLTRVNGASFRPERDVFAAFAELRIPIVGSDSSDSGPPRLELSVADRQEHYSDFGSSNNPKVGITWRPSADLQLRGTYGTSFKAALLNDLNPIPTSVTPFPEFDPLTGANTNVFVVFGGNSDLEPEEATTWTLGLDLKPRRWPGLRANATYYDIRFTDRIVNAQLSGFDVFDALRNEAVLGPTIVQRNPSFELVQELAASPGYLDSRGTGITDLTTIRAIIDSRQNNLSIVETSGIDLDFSYAASSSLGRWELGLNSSCILEFGNQFASSTPLVDILNTPFNPIDLKLRGRGTIQRNGLGLAVFINHLDSYTDNRRGTSIPVDSWTTADFTASYGFDADKGFANGVSVVLSVVNLTDEDPPFVASNIAPPLGTLHYDGANANPLGRFFALQVSKRWQ